MSLDSYLDPNPSISIKCRNLNFIDIIIQLLQFKPSQSQKIMLSKNNSNRWRPEHRHQIRLQFPSQGHSAYYEGVGKRHYSQINNRSHQYILHSPQFQRQYPYDSIDYNRDLDLELQHKSLKNGSRSHVREVVGDFNAKQEDSLELLKKRFLRRPQQYQKQRKQRAQYNNSYIMDRNDYNNVYNPQLQSTPRLSPSTNPYLNLHKNPTPKLLPSSPVSPSYRNIFSPIEDLYDIVHRQEKSERLVGKNNSQTLESQRNFKRGLNPTYLSSKLGV